MSNVTIRRLPALGLLVTCTAPSLAGAYDIKMPWRGDALPAHSYVRTDGHGSSYHCPNGGGCSNDIFGVRWDAAAGSYTRSSTAPSLTGWTPGNGTELNYDGILEYLLWGDPIGHRMDSDSVGEGSAPDVSRTPFGGVYALRDELGDRRGGTVDGASIVTLGLDGHPTGKDLVVLPIATTTLIGSLQHFISNYGPQ